jgi:hypothetical protein
VASFDVQDDSFSLTRVTSTLALLTVLALVLPFAAVKTLHARRLKSADRDLLTIATMIRRLDASRIPPGTDALSGGGSRPRAIDERWNSSLVVPLSRFLTTTDGQPPVDPWGNSYLVILDGARAPEWVVSAGADGILETPLDPRISAASGDDRAARVPSVTRPALR